jgi:sialate O-acetylesterase
MKAIHWAVTGAVSVLGLSAFADVKLPAVFSDNMVLQRMEKAPFFGTADKGEKVTVKVGQASAEATAGDDGKWRATLDTRELRGPVEVSVAGNNSIAIKNVLVGEVWVASGQSNMEMSVGGSKDADLEQGSSDYPEIRMFTVEKATSFEPAKDVRGKWEVCSPAVVGHFSAVGYFFARDLHQQLKVPVGVIHTSWGGTVAEAWTSREALAAADPDVKVLLERIDAAREKLTPEVKEKYASDVKEWQKAGSPRGKQPQKPRGSEDPNAPTNLFNGMVAPIVGYGIKGTIWYQGESNAGRAYQYRKLFPIMITDWRTRWGEGDFSFYWVQLANYMPREKEPADSAWAELREAQTMTQALPNTGQAVIIDIGEGLDIHPRNKQDVGRRLARLALAKDYGKKIVDSGPVYESMTVEGNAVRLRFKNAGGGLVLKEKQSGFAIAGEDKKFVWADAKVDKDTILVQSPGVAKPVAVRYAWGNNPDAAFYNKANLPACPFRTDDWPGVTAGKN